MCVPVTCLQKLLRHRIIISSKINNSFNKSLKFNYFFTLCSKIKCRDGRNEWLLTVGTVHTNSVGSRRELEYVGYTVNCSLSVEQTAAKIHLST
jgi:hypothetical protein